MNVTITIDCDQCNNCHVIMLDGKNAIDVWRDGLQKLTTHGIREELRAEGWHMVMSCLCPECKAKVTEQNCMNCAHQGYRENNHRCLREISRAEGFMQYDGSIVSEFDVCKHFKE